MVSESKPAPSPGVRRTIGVASIALAILGSSSTLRPGVAAARGYGGRPLARAPAVDDGPQVPNVPDRHGCVKLCDLDTNPCDTPLEKKLDGRCTLQDN